MKKIVLLFVIFFHTPSSIPALCTTPKRVLFYSNGMFNSFESARDLLKELKSDFQKRYPQTVFDNDEIAYNTNEFALTQMFEVYKQKTEDMVIGFWGWLGELTGLEKNPIMQKFIQDFYSEQRAHDQDLSQQIRTYRKYLDNGYRVVTVAHSQGNFYTNFSFEQIGSFETKMVSVATPASFVYAGGDYYTFKSDGVIKYIPSALEPNRQKKDPGLFDHGFLTYMDESSIEDEVIHSIYINAAYDQGRPQSLDQKDGYFNKDMDNILQWYSKTLETNTDVSWSECMLAYAFFQVASHSRLGCTERNKLFLKEILSACLDQLADQSGIIYDNPKCPFVVGMEILDIQQNNFPMFSSEFFHKFPRCQIDRMMDFKSLIKKDDLYEAIKMADTVGIKK